MKSLTTYINEQIDERVKLLNKWLRGKQYDDYVGILDKMLRDDKTRKLLIDGFGGDLGTLKLRYNVVDIQAKKLQPMSSEIDLDKSLKYGLSDLVSCKETFEEPLIINKPIITFNKKYVVDGHHSWIQAMAFNPNAKMFCFNYDGKVTTEELLKCVQGVIAAVKAENKNKKKELEHKSVGEHDFYKMSKQDVYEYIDDLLAKECSTILCENMRVGKDNLVKVISDNLRMMLKNNPPIKNAPKQINMPNVWDGGTKDDDEGSAEPIYYGSALNKMKEKKILRTAVR